MATLTKYTKLQPLTARMCQSHYSHTIRQFNIFSADSRKQKDWALAVSAAEKVVGYPTSFMNLRFWLSDEMSNVAVNMRKLIGTKHPLMKTAKGLIFDDKENIQTRGLVVLLMSKGAGYPDHVSQFEHHPLDTTYSAALSQPTPNGILPTQRSLAEITEMIHTAYVLHKGVMDIKRDGENENLTAQDIDDLLYGNKMALLSGDYLLAKASAGLAALGNTYVVEIMASAIADLMESRFMADELATTSRTITFDNWKDYAFRNGGCLYAKSCQSTVMLSGHSSQMANSAFKFGQNFGLLRQLKVDITESKHSNSPDIWSISHILSQSDTATFCEDMVRETLDSLHACQLKNVEASAALESFVHAL